VRRVIGVSGILFSEALAAERVVVFAKACELGLEGIVSKRRAASIRAGEAAIGSRP
jgi:ATP-dependent DNA ligase